jgi:hypothetical protein
MLYDLVTFLPKSLVLRNFRDYLTWTSCDEYYSCMGNRSDTQIEDLFQNNGVWKGQCSRCRGHTADWETLDSSSVVERDFHLLHHVLQNVPSGSGAHLPLCSICTVFLSRGKGAEGVKLTISMSSQQLYLLVLVRGTENLTQMQCLKQNSKPQRRYL